MGTRFAYRRFGKASGVPLVFNQHFTGTMDHWDPAVIDGFAKDREVILFNNAGVSSSSGVSSARRWYYRLGLDSAGIVTKWSVSVCRNVTMSLSSWPVSPRLPIKVDTLAGVSGGGQQLTFSPGEN
jgi:pimeloyl-ACP methyl ester carboxylesterase